MIYICYDQESKVLITKIHNVFTQADFDMYFMPEFNSLARKFKKVNVLVEFADDFDGWQFSTLLREVKFSFEHLHTIEKIAIVGNSSVLKWSFRFFHPFTYLSIQRFTTGKFEHALAWSTWSENF